jgi:hypothetical protein
MKTAQQEIDQIGTRPDQAGQRGYFRSKLCSLLSGDTGMSTAEYAIGTVAAAAFAALLYSVLTGDSITGALTSLIQRALESNL